MEVEEKTKDQLIAEIRKLRQQVLELESSQTLYQQIELALGRAIEEQETVMEAILDIVYVLDLKGNLLKWNKRLEFVTGLGPEVLKGRSALAFFPEAEQATIAKAIQQVFQKGKAKVEAYLIGKNEVLLPYEWNGVTLKDEAGNVIGMAGSGRDITERKKAEQVQKQLNADLESLVQERTAQLQRALEFEAMLKRITDKVRDSLDENQILQTVTQELTLVLGIVGCDVALYNLEQSTSSIRCEYAAASAAGNSTRLSVKGQLVQMANIPVVYRQLLQGEYLQFCEIDPNSKRNRMTVLSCPIVDSQGVLGDLWLFKQNGDVFAAQEIRLVQQVANQCAIAMRTARLYQAVTMQVQELEQLNFLKDDFLSTVSHELRTPVTNIKIAIQMLQIAVTPEQRERYLKILQTECDREVELINNLLDLQRLESAFYNICLEFLNLQSLIPTIIEPFHFRSQLRQQTLQVNLSPDLPLLLCDRACLERILAELLNNACKYTPAGGEISLSIDYKPSRSAATSGSVPVTVFCIRNQAEITTMALPHIFEKFYRFPQVDRGKQGGTGLGLALVQKLVELLSGTISVESSGGWTTFTIELPNRPKA